MFYYPRSDDYIDDFVTYKDLNEFGREIKFGEISLDEAEKRQEELLNKMNKLKKHNPRNDDRKEFKKEVLDKIEKVFNARIDIIKGFRDGIVLIRPETEKHKTDMSEPESDNEQPKKIPEWIRISNNAFTLLKNRIGNAVNKNLGPFIDKEKISYLPLQEFLQNILDGRFNNAEEAREYYTKNIYEDYQTKMNK